VCLCVFVCVYVCVRVGGGKGGGGCLLEIVGQHFAGEQCIVPLVLKNLKSQLHSHNLQSIEQRADF